MRHASWPTVQLEEVCEHITVGHVGPMVNEYIESGVPFLRSQNVRPFRFDPTELKFIAPAFHAKLKKSALRPMDVVVTRSGANTGQCCIIPPHLTDANCSDLVIIRPSERIDPWYLMYVLNSDWGRATIAGGVVGAAQHHFNIGVARIFPVQLPPLPVQRRIAGILSAYDELMENSQRRIRLLEAMARALYREWFVHFRFPGHDMKSSASGKSPDCASGMLGGLCDLTKDTYDDAEHSELPLLDLAHIPSRTLAPQDTGKPSELTTSRIVFQKGDTLFGAIRCYLHKVVAAHYSGVTNTSVLVLRPKKPCFRSLLAIIASDAETIRWAETQSTGTKMPVINWGIFQKMPAPVPSEAVAREFEKVAGPLLDQIGVHANQIQNLRRTRDLLLPRLLSREVNLKEN